MTEDAVKIALHGPDGKVETLWANAADEPGLYVLDNVPWFAYHVSLGDTVEARPVADGYLEMVRVVRKSGNRTIWVILEIAASCAWTERSRALVAGIRARGCGFEGMNRQLVALTVPPAVDLLELGDYIDQAGFDFEYADPTAEELFPDDARGSDEGDGGR
jgi:hypothetical protein